MRKSLLLSAAAIMTISSPINAQDADDVDALRAQVAELTAQLEALSARLDEVEDTSSAHAVPAPAPAVAAAPSVTADNATQISMGAAPEVESDDGFSFKPFGRLMLDAGWTALPDGLGLSDGFDAEIRRARLGVSGDIPGGFAYKMEVDFAGNEVTITDALIEYGAGDFDIMVGQFNNFQSMEELTSSRFTSFIERAAFTDAFGFTRRAGVAVEYGGDNLLVQGGIFADNFEDMPGSDRWSVDGRAAFFPEVGDTQLHFGGSLHYAEIGEGETVRYRQRPLVHFTSNRLINTGNLPATSEFGAGLEFAAINGPFHVAAEGYRQKLSGLPTMQNATFHGGFVEAGIFLTPGDSRGYSGGRFNRTRPANPVGEGGIGAVQLNVRYDYLELNDADAGIIGGTQNGFLASLIWTTTDHTRFQINYGKLDYSDAAIALPSGDRDYSADAIGMRAEFDF
ncbi:OprO/OprP family phosphate-selective porin [Erythrobacter alti]|uniref:OprO/OprP family phosphate-selective porin n=1 Tax=Erythrobacter alti TaxID=1896145 RepID=UPI0030F37DDE